MQQLALNTFTVKGKGSIHGQETKILQASDLMKKVGKNTGLFRYDINQIPYDYTVEVTNRFKGLNLIDRVPEKLWMEVHDIVQEAVITVQEAVIKTTPKKKKCKKAKWLSDDALQIAAKGREAKGEVEKERYTHLNAVPKNSKER